MNRRIADLPKNADLYSAAMVRTHIQVAHTDKIPAILPNRRCLGVGSELSQIIKDVPATAELASLR